MSDSEEDCEEKQLKLVVFGEQNVGKTTLIKKFCYDEFSRIYIPTIGADFYIKRFTLSGNREIIVRITDVSGSELNGHMLETYLFKANLIILVYDITNSGTFNILTQWLQKINQIIQNCEEKIPISIALIGNKCDLEHKRTVRTDITNHFVNENKLLNYYVSAKTGECVNSTFIELMANYLNVPFSNLERDKQKPVIRAELTPNSPIKNKDKRKFRVKKMKLNNLKNCAKNKNNKEAANNNNNKNVSNQTCAIQ